MSKRIFILLYEIISDKNLSLNLVLPHQTVVHITKQSPLSLLFCVVHWRIVHLLFVNYTPLFHLFFAFLFILLSNHIIYIIYQPFLFCFCITDFFTKNATPAAHSQNHDRWPTESWVKSEVHDHRIVFFVLTSLLIEIIEDYKANNAPNESEDIVQNVE